MLQCFVFTIDNAWILLNFSCEYLDLSAHGLEHCTVFVKVNDTVVALLGGGSG